MDTERGLVPITRTTATAVKEDAKVAVLLKILRMTEPDANHRDNATDLVPSIANRLDRIGIGFSPDFSLFASRYVSSAGGFVVVMPISFANALRARDPFNAYAPTCTYKLEAVQDDFQASGARADTGFQWATGILSVGATDTLKEIEQATSAALKSISMNPTEIIWLTDKKRGGAGIGKVRVAFLTSDAFDLLNLHRVRVIKLPSDATVTLKFSAEFCSSLNVHANCLKTLNKRDYRLNLTCTCSSGAAGPSASRASAEAAKADYRARALKRARDEHDPFA